MRQEKGGGGVSWTLQLILSEILKGEAMAAKSAQLHVNGEHKQARHTSDRQCD